MLVLSVHDMDEVGFSFWSAVSAYRIRLECW